MNLETTFTYQFTINILVTASVAILYSFAELLQKFKNVKQIFCNLWGWTYLLLNGLVAIFALILAFKHEISGQVMLGKALLAGTSGLALLRVVSVNYSKDGVNANPVAIVDIFRNHLVTGIDREKYEVDILKVKDIMKQITDYRSVANNLPLLFSYGLVSLSEDEKSKMKKEIEELLQSSEGKETKGVMIGVILSRYVGTITLEKTIEALKDELNLNIVATPVTTESLDDLIKKFSI